MPIARIESLDHEGQGVARLDGKTVFVEGALPGETVEFSSWRKKPRFELANLVAVRTPSAARAEPRCRYFGVCGGCSLQHLDSRAQVAVKQRVLEDNLRHIGNVVPELMLPAIHGPAWRYRDRARFSVRRVAKKNTVLVGFHEKRSSFIADTLSCEVVPQRVSDLLPQLRRLVDGLSIRERLPQIETVNAGGLTLVLRILKPLTESDEARLREFADEHGVALYLQPGGPDSARPFHPPDPAPPQYALPDFALAFPFRPTDFTQVNLAMNPMLVRRALQLLDPQPGERIADLFCGLGNFTLPIARRGAEVVGIEGSAALAERGHAVAAGNGLADRIRFRVANLFEATEESIAALGRFDGMLLDPPRVGAVEVVKALGVEAPRRIVYVSCNPATLARDAAVLVHAKGYRLAAAGVVNMFPHTSHVESVALFQRG